MKHIANLIRSVKYYIFITMLTVSSEASHAHPVDDPCPPEKVTEDGCQPTHGFMGLNSPEFFRAHKKYWHCRRELNKVIRDYSACVGATKDAESVLGFDYLIVSTELLNYWDVIPAHPELDYPGEVWRAESQTEACDATRAIGEFYLIGCEAYRQQLRQKIAAEVWKVCPVEKKPKKKK